MNNITVEWNDLANEDLLFNQRINKMNRCNINFYFDVSLNRYCEMSDNQECLDDVRAILVGTRENIIEYLELYERMVDVDEYVVKNTISDVTQWKQKIKKYKPIKRKVVKEEITFDKLIEEYKDLIKPYIAYADEALLLCFKQNKKAIKQLISNGYLADDSKGESFHKAFRQTDVCENSNQDMIIWNLLHASKWFFYLIEEWNELRYFRL